MTALNLCINKDCLAYMQEHPGIKPKLIIMDPPYNYGQAYAAYHDSSVSFPALLRSWLFCARNFLADDGSMWVFLPDEWVSLADQILTGQCLMYRRSWIVWYYTFGVSCKDNFARSHTHILYMTKSKTEWTFNKDPVVSQRQMMGDTRAAPGGKHADNTWIVHPSQLPGAFDDSNDVWLQSRVCGTFKEREPHSPNQLPLPVIERIVKVATNVGDLVYDPFLGTGTTGVACKKLDRLFLGTDVSSVCTEKSRERILAT